MKRVLTWLIVLAGIGAIAGALGLTKHDSSPGSPAVVTTPSALPAGTCEEYARLKRQDTLSECYHGYNFGGIPCEDIRRECGTD